MKPESLHRTFLVSMIIISLLTLGLVGYFWLSDEYTDFKSNSSELRSLHVEKQKKFIRGQVESVLNFIEHKREVSNLKLKRHIKQKVYEAISVTENLNKKFKGRRSKDEIIEMIKEALRQVRFKNGRGYYFIYDINGYNILHPLFPHQENRKMLDLQGLPGDYIIRRGISLIKNKNEGYLNTHWYRTEKSKNVSKKILFLKYYSPLKIWIGTGEYVADYERELQKEILRWVNKVRFGENGYIFAYDFNGITLSHYNQRKVGTNRWELEDATGMKVVQELIRTSKKEGGGYLKYIATLKPETGQPSAKIGYTRSIPDWGWIIGAGVYIDDIESEISTKKEILESKIQDHTMKVIAVLAFSFLIIILIARYISNRTFNNIELFTRFFKSASTSSEKIEQESIHFLEFKALADSANKMLDDRTAAENELKKTQEQLIRAKKMEALGLLAGGVAHDLNNVLSGIVSYPELILMDLPEDNPLHKKIKTIRDAGLNAAAIVQDLLTLARRGVITKKVLNVNDLVNEYLESPEHENLRELHPDVKLKLNLENELININGSSIHLKKAIMNLVTNAFEAQPDGGMVIIETENYSIEKQNETHKSMEKGNHVLLRIKDRGIGISESDLEHIFEPFYTKKIMGKSGTGLGMAVVWGAVQDHDGQINVESKVGKGTTFEILFRATNEVPDNCINETEINCYMGNGESVLIVDDVKEQRDIASGILERLNYSVKSVSSGEDAIEFIKKQGVDILLLDMIMEPGIDGLDTFREIIKINPLQKSVIASGFAANEKVTEAQKIGAGRYIKKPYKLERLARAIKDEIKSY